MKSATTQDLRRHVKRIRQIIARQRSPLASMTKEQVIEALRKTREELWEAKFAPRA